MSRILELREKAKKNRKRIVLPEGDDERVVEAASYVAKERIADVALLGRKADVALVASRVSADLGGVIVIDPTEHADRKKIIEEYYRLRKHKGITIEDAEKILMENFVFYGAMMTRFGMADGFVAGANHTTGDVARAAIHCLELDREIGTLSSSFAIEIENCPFGENGLFIFADCGIVPFPSPKQLAGIAIASSDLFKKVFGMVPRVAMLSYSTKGSASGESIENVRSAIEKVREKRPDLLIDGELQVDTAIVPEVALIKYPSGPIGGKANVLIFPNLDAGNISYKLVQRLAGARAAGPLLQGLTKPGSDLSRGCSLEDVVDTAAITAVRAQ